jgi:molybdate transport system regulatory protein
VRTLRHHPPRTLQASVVLFLGRTVVLDPLRAQLLSSVDRGGSIRAAAQNLQISYMHAWVLLRDMGVSFGGALVESQSGGGRGGKSWLTSAGREVLTLYRAVEEETRAASARPLSRLRKLLSE